jgi:membrane-associated protein
MKKILNLSKTIFATDILFPLLLIIFYIGFFFFARQTLPTGDELVTLFREVYSTYGYQIIFFAALLEALILVNFLVPGSLALAMGAVFAKSGGLSLELVILTAGSGAVIGYTVDYFLGRLGLDAIINKLGYKKTIIDIEKKLNKKTLTMSFINPTIASFFSISAGIVKFNPVTFLLISTLATFVWFSIWAILFYLTGDVLLEILTRYFTLVFVIIIGATMLAQYINKREKVK